MGVGKAKKNNKAGAWRSSLLYSEASFLGLDRVSDCAVWLSPAKVVRVCDFVLKTFSERLKRPVSYREIKKKEFLPCSSENIDLKFRHRFVVPPNSFGKA